MKSLPLFVIVLLILGFSSCSSDRNSDDAIQKDIQTKVESFIRKKEADFDHKFESFKGFNWDFDRIDSPDSTIYPFTVVFKRNGREYPFKHRCIVKADTLLDILEFNHLSSSWTSILPVPYDVRKESWWVELDSVVSVVNLQYDRRKLLQTDSISNTWIEVFTGDVEITTQFGTFTTDTLYWDPKRDEIKAPLCHIESRKNGKSFKLEGYGLTTNSGFNTWTLDHAIGQSILEK